MARLALALVGGLIGAEFGVPQLGFLVGNLLGGILFPDKGPSGPRMQDLTVTSSAYGQMIIQGHGTARVPGNMIWGRKIKEKKHSGGKGLGGGATGDTFTYSWTGAVAVGRGPIADITRIWADTKLVYDKTGTTPQTAKQKKKALKFRLYKGTEDQPVDPAIVATQGLANTTAHRGMAYVLFDDIPLADYGNRVPSWTFEVAWAATPSTTKAAATTIVGGPLTHNENNQVLAVDWDHERFFTVVDTPTEGFRAYNLISMTEYHQGVVAVGGQASVGPDGFIYAMTDTGSNTRAIRKIDPDSMTVVATVGSDSSEIGGNGNGTFVALKDIAWITVLEIIPQFYGFTASTLNDLGLFYTDDMHYVWGKLKKVDEQRCAVVGGQPQEDTAYGFALGFASFGGASLTPMGVYQLEVHASAEVGTNVDTGENNTLVFQTKLGTISPADVSPTWTVFSDMGQFVFDYSDSTLIFGVKGGVAGGAQTAHLVKYDPSTTSIVWSTAVGAIMNITANHNLSRVTTGKYAYVVSSTLYDVDTDSGAITSSVLSSFVEAGPQVYDGERDVIITKPNSGAFTMLLLHRASKDGRNVSDIIIDVCSQVGLEESDLDLTQITDTVKGFLINQQMTARAAIEPLGFAYLFDGVESDYVLKFVKRGQSVAVTIPEDHIVRADDNTGAVVKETRTQEVELPLAVNVVYLDVDRDYQQSTMRVKRISLPFPSMSSKNESSVTVPIVMDAAQAKNLAARVLYATWQERVTHDYTVSWRYLKYDPTDVASVVLNDGVTLTDRIVNSDAGADLSIQIKSVSERAVQYISNVPADGGTFPEQHPPASGASRYFLLDSPLLRDQDQGPLNVSRLYFTASGYGQDNWPGEILLRSSDGSAYSGVGAIVSPAAWGVTTNGLGDTDVPFQIDTVNTITVVMINGADDIASCTELEMMNGANACALLNEVTGEIEIVGFKDFVLNDDNSFTLSNLFRGQRGTEVYTGAHVGGEVLILLDANTFGTVAMALSDLNVDRFFKGVPVGEIQENGDDKIIRDTGRDLKPYAPCQQAAAVAGSDIALTWERRTRTGGGMVDGSGTVPLSEATEAYEVDIYNALGDTVVRTLTGLTTPAATYLAADITSDLGGLPATLTIAVYQISAAVGRGFTKIVTIPVT